MKLGRLFGRRLLGEPIAAVATLPFAIAEVGRLVLIRWRLLVEARALSVGIAMQGRLLSWGAGPAGSRLPWNSMTMSVSCARNCSCPQRAYALPATAPIYSGPVTTPGPMLFGPDDRLVKVDRRPAVFPVRSDIDSSRVGPGPCQPGPLRVSDRRSGSISSSRRLPRSSARSFPWRPALGATCAQGSDRQPVFGFTRFFSPAGLLPNSSMSWHLSSANSLPGTATGRRAI